MLEFEKIRHRKQMPKLLSALQKKQYVAHFFETIDEARKFIPTLVKAKETVGVGGSMTIRQNLGLVELLRAQGNSVCDHWDAKNKKERIELKRKQSGMDVFFSSVNAITCDGIMVNLDGGGNRVGGLCSGPKRAIVVVGHGHP